MKTILFLIPLTLILTSCQDDEVLTENPVQGSYIGIDSRLLPYFEEFEVQGSLRGLHIDLAAAGITASIEDLEEADVAGQCTYGGIIDGHIIIDSGFWNRFTQTDYREMVIFHELGHCYLHRDHLEGAFANGTCISIMRSGLEACTDNYRSSTRKYYLDELFSGF